MASTYGTLTTEHRDYIQGKLANVLEEDENGQICTVEYYRKAFDENTGIVDPEFDNGSPYATPPTNVIDKADIIGIYVESTKESLLGSVSSFSVFGNSATGGSGLKYTSYREEIIRNENPEK